MHTYQLCWFSQESPNFSSKKVRALNLLGNTYHGLFQNLFIDFVILEISKRKIKQGVDLALLLKLSSIGKRKTEQSIWYIFYESSIVIGQKSTNQKLVRFLHAVFDVGNIRKAFGWFSESIQTCRKWHSYNAKISRCLQIFVLWGLAGMKMFHYTQCINNRLEDCSFLTFFYKIHLSKDSLHFERTWEMSEKTLLMPHQLLCNMYWLNHLDGISLHLQCPKVEASQPNKTKGINEAHTVLIVLWFNFVAVSVDFLQSGIARFFSSAYRYTNICLFFLTMIILIKISLYCLFVKLLLLIR